MDTDLFAPKCFTRACVIIAFNLVQIIQDQSKFRHMKGSGELGYIYGEIQGQYEALVRTGECLEKHAQNLCAVLTEFAGPLVYIGSGSSFSIAQSAALTARIALRRNAFAIAAGDLLLHLDAYAPLLEDAILIAFSRSGETSELVRATKALGCREIPFFLLSFTCVENSTLAQQSNLAINLTWAFDYSVCQTRTASNLYCASLWLIALWTGNETLSTQLKEVAKRGPDYLAQYDTVFRQIAQKQWSSGVVLGDAELNGICDEGAMAFKEICQVPSNCYHLLDVRHGPMVLVGKDTLVIAALSDADNPLERALLTDMLKKGATVVAYSDHPTGIEGVYDISLGIPLAHAVRGLPVIAICQMITYYKALERGVNPDKPDGLEPWIKL